jgi:uncharacterized protein (TIGR03435 family)
MNATMMKRLTIVTVLWVLNASLQAQSPLAFEIASIKRGTPGAGVRGGCHGIDSGYSPNEAASAPPLGRCVIRDGRLGHLLFIAYRLHSMSFVEGGPDWVKMGEDRFNIEAKVEDPTKATEQQLYQMLQALLTERFSLKFHRETRDLSGFALVVAKKGPKLKPSDGQDVVADWGPSFKPSRGPNTLTARNYSMARLAEALAVFGNPVLDKTGLTGVYDFTLSWDETDGPQLSTALEQQLGLKFESQKVPVSFIVIESAQKPTGN